MTLPAGGAFTGNSSTLLTMDLTAERIAYQSADTQLETAL